METSAFIAFAFLGATAAAQLINFECQAPGALPAWPAVNCEGSGGVAAGAEIVTLTSGLPQSFTIP